MQTLLIGNCYWKRKWYLLLGVTGREVASQPFETVWLCQVLLLPPGWFSDKEIQFKQTQTPFLATIKWQHIWWHLFPWNWGFLGNLEPLQASLAHTVRQFCPRTTWFHSDVNRSIYSLFLGIRLVPEQGQKVSPVFSWLRVTEGIGSGDQTRLSMTHTLTQHAPQCACSQQAQESLVKHCSPWRTAPGAQPATTPLPVHTCGLIQARGDKCWEEHVWELEVRCGTAYIWVHLVQDGTGSCAVLNCVQETVASKTCPFANWFGIRSDTQGLTEIVHMQDFLACIPLFVGHCPHALNWEDLKTLGSSEKVISTISDCLKKAFIFFKCFKCFQCSKINTETCICI